MTFAIGVFSLFLHLTFASNTTQQDVDLAVNTFLKSTGATAASVAIFSKNAWQFEKHYGVATDQSKYDMASLTKPLATTFAALWLIENHLADKNEQIVKTLPEFAQCKWPQELFPVHAVKFKWRKPPELSPELCAKKKSVTVELLMRHRSGFSDVVPLDAITVAAVESNMDPMSLFTRSPVLKEPGTSYLYADTNFIVLKRWIEQKLKPIGKSYTELLQSALISKFSLVDTGFFSDLNNRLDSTFVPSLKIQSPGMIHDPIARALGPNANGHAGLYSSLRDLKKFASFWMNVNRDPFLSATESPDELAPGQKRGLGWDVDTKYTPYIRGPIPGGFGHTGYTGQSIWIEPKSKTIVLVLTNRTYLTEGALTRDAFRELTKTVANVAWELSHP